MRDIDDTEAISALMDGEAADASALDVLIQNDSLRRTWGRYHTISDCLAGRLPARVDRRLADRISLAVRNEPAIVAPSPERSPRRPRQILRPLAGLAIAASVAAVAILGVKQQREVDTGVSPAAPVAAVTAPRADSAAQLPAAQREFNLAAGGATAATPPPQARPAAGGINPRLNRYLVNYNEYRRNAAVQGMLPYVRIVAQDEGQ